MRPVSVARMGFSRLIVVIAATTLGPLGAAAPVGWGHRLAGFARRRAWPTARRLAGWRLLALPWCAGPSRALDDRLDDLGLRRPGMPGPRRGGAFGRPGSAAAARGGLAGAARTLDRVLAAGRLFDVVSVIVGLRRPSPQQ